MGRVGRVALVGLVVVAACSREAPHPPPSANVTPRDAQHQGITTPHGDHSAHHGGLVLMNGELHYEVVFDRKGQHRIWFTDAVRQDLPASLARDVRMIVTRPHGAAETIALGIDEAGESWVAKGQPVDGDGVMVKVSYTIRGAPHEVEIPFVITAK